MTVDLTQFEERACDHGRELQGTKVRLMSGRLIVTSRAHCHLCIIGVLICGNPNSSLHATLYVTLLSVHLHKLSPRFLRVPWGVKASLISLLRLFLVMQAKAEVPKDLPLKACLPISYMLRLEMSHFSSEDSPHS